jgi:cyanate lyase
MGLARLLLTGLIDADFGEGIQNSINLILRKRGRSDLNKRNKIKGAKRLNVQFSTRTVLILNPISYRVAL